MEEDDDLPSKKKRRPPAPRHSPTTRTPLVTLSGHNQPVTAVVWPNNKEDGVITAGWDHCIRLWDLTSGVNTATLVRWGLHYFKTNNILFKQISSCSNYFSRLGPLYIGHLWGPEQGYL